MVVLINNMSFNYLKEEVFGKGTDKKCNSVTVDYSIYYKNNELSGSMLIEKNIDNMTIKQIENEIEKNFLNIVGG